MIYTAESSQSCVSPQRPTSFISAARGHALGPLLILASGALSIAGTSNVEPGRIWTSHALYESKFTSSSPNWGGTKPLRGEQQESGKAISELRRISGLTWDQLSDLFGVSRRSLHFWASGKPLNASNEQSLVQILDIVGSAHQGIAKQTRSKLLKTQDGQSIFSALKEGRYDDARTLVGSIQARRKPKLMELSYEAKEARKPLPPRDLIDAENAPVHRERGTSRAARTSKGKQRGNQ